MFGRAQLWMTVSLLTLIVSVVVVLVIRPQWGIDFTGGSLMEIATHGATPEAVREVVATQVSSVTTQAGSGNTVLIRMEPLNDRQHQQLLQRLGEEGVLQEELRFESIGPTIGAELRRKAVSAISIVVVVLIGYLAYVFRQAKALVASWKFGVAAVFALLHDLVVVLALFVIFGKVWGVSIDTLFVTAMLAILGYSVNDTIVIFNRLRLEWSQGATGLREALDRAVRASLMRSLNTSLTTLVVLGALLVFGGTTIQWFVVALALGTILGTYSSLFVAPPALYYLARVRK